MITVYRNKTKEPVTRMIEMVDEREKWQDRVRAFQHKYNGRKAVSQHDNLTGADIVVGLEDTGIVPFGFAKYDGIPYLVPRKGKGHENALDELARIGKSPAVNQIMSEEFDVPPYYMAGQQMLYPGFELIPTFADENGPEGYEPGDLVTADLYVYFNIIVKEAWNGGEHFERIKAWEFLKAKDI
jgi:hypothetical protein